MKSPHWLGWIPRICGTVPGGKTWEQFLDCVDLREGGITVGTEAVKLEYFSWKHGGEYLFHPVDIPGRVNCSYGVLESLATCDSPLRFLLLAQSFWEFVCVEWVTAESFLYEVKKQGEMSGTAR